MKLFATKVKVLQPLRVATQSSILVVVGLLDPPLFFLSSIEERLGGCFTTCLPEQFLRKPISCIILHCFALLMPTLTQWPGNFRNYHVLRALTSSSKIFRIQQNRQLDEPQTGPEQVIDSLTKSRTYNTLFSISISISLQKVGLTIHCS